MTDRLEETAKGGEYHIPDVLADMVQQEPNRPTACWPFFAERYVWGEITLQTLLSVGRVGVPSVREDYIAVFVRADDGNRRESRRSRKHIQRLNVKLGDRHECAVLVRINEGVENPQCVPRQMPFEGRWFSVPTLIRLERFQEAQDITRKKFDDLSLPRTELSGIVIDGELERPLVGKVVGSGVFERNIVNEVVEGRAEIAKAVPDQRRKFGGRSDRRVHDELIEKFGSGVIRFWLVLTDKTIRLHVEKPADTVVDVLKMFVRPTELAPLGHCLGLNR
jgi:hypothetical protein